MRHVDIVFDGPPGPVTGRFVEVEDENRASIRMGEWVERDDGYWVLRLDRSEALRVLFPDGPTDEMVEAAAREWAKAWGYRYDDYDEKYHRGWKNKARPILDAAFGLADRTTSEYESNTDLVEGKDE